MDKTVDYREQCAMAGEIQAYGGEHYDDLMPVFIYDELLDRMCIHVWFPKALREAVGLSQPSHIISIEKDRDKHTYIQEGVEGQVIWLPTQDQLQEILSLRPRSNYTAVDWVFLIHEWSYTFYEEKTQIVPQSMEQLWLAFVMHEKYKKKWDGQAWI